MAGDFVWPGEAKAAVTLAYHGALPEHLEIVEPLLRRNEIRASFFVRPQGVLDNVLGWQALAEEGHEIGNGCLYGVTDDGRLPNWTRRMVEQDLHMTQQFLRDIFPNQEPISFAYPGRNPLCAQGTYTDIVGAEFKYAMWPELGLSINGSEQRFGSTRGLAEWSPETLGSVLGLKEENEQARRWTVLLFDRFFDYESNKALIAHAFAVELLAQRHQNVWIAPFSEVATHILQQQEAMRL